MPPSIEQLAALARSGDRLAFAAVLEQTLPAVRRFLLRLGVNVQELDDLTQEVFVTVIENLDQFRGASRFTTWQMGVATNVFRASRRRKSSLQPSRADRPAVDRPSDDRGADPSSRLSTGDDAARVMAVVADLPDLLREVFVLRYVEELPANEVGQIVGAPEGTVRRRAKDARDRVRSALTKGGVIA